MSIINIISKIKTKIASLCSEYGRSKGSVLIEIALLISIMAIISGVFLSKTNVVSKLMRRQDTQKNIEIAIEALVEFIANNNRLPCPSLDQQGFEETGCVSNLAHCVGSVPFNTLGIPEKFTKDEDNKPLKYIVEPELTKEGESIYFKKDSCFCREVDPKITIENLSTPKQNPIAFVIDKHSCDISIDNEQIFIKKTYNTFWIKRDLILIQYLKAHPCKNITEPHISQTEISGDEIFNNRLFDLEENFSL